MNRRSFMKAVSLAVAVPVLPVAAITQTMGVDMAVGESVHIWEMYSSSLDGMLRTVYLPEINKIVCRDVPIMDLLKSAGDA